MHFGWQVSPLAQWGIWLGFVGAFSLMAYSVLRPLSKLNLLEKYDEAWWNKRFVLRLIIADKRSQMISIAIPRGRPLENTVVDLAAFFDIQGTSYIPEKRKTAPLLCFRGRLHQGNSHGAKGRQRPRISHISI